MKCNQTILGQPELFELASLKHCLMWNVFYANVADYFHECVSNQVEKELRDICQDILDVLDKHLIPSRWKWDSADPGIYLIWSPMGRLFQTMLKKVQRRFHNSDVTARGSFAEVPHFSELKFLYERNMHNCTVHTRFQHICEKVLQWERFWKWRIQHSQFLQDVILPLHLDLLVSLHLSNQQNFGETRSCFIFLILL